MVLGQIKPKDSDHPFHSPRQDPPVSLDIQALRALLPRALRSAYRVADAALKRVFRLQVLVAGSVGSI